MKTVNVKTHKRKGRIVKAHLRKGGIQFSGYNKPVKTPGHPTKSHAVLAKEGEQIKLLRFGQQGVEGSPKKEGESESYKKRRESFKARHAANIAKGKMSPAWWSNSVKWAFVPFILNLITF